MISVKPLCSQRQGEELRADVQKLCSSANILLFKKDICSGKKPQIYILIDSRG